jgi:Na+/melibiose symporter-like transporter
VTAALIVELHGSFRIVFWGSAILPVLGMIVIALLVPNGHGPVPGAPAKWWQAVDLFGAAGFAIPVIALDIAFSEGPAWGWGSGRVILLIVIAVVVAIAWVLVERRVANPLVDQFVFWSRPMWVSNAVSILCGFTALGTIIATSTFAQLRPAPGLHGLGAGPVAGAWVIIPIEWGGLIMGPFTGYLSQRMGKGPFLCGGSIVECLGLLLVIAFHASLAELAICMTIVGIGVGMVISSFSLIKVEDAPPEHVARMFGICRVLANGVGGAIGGAVLGAFLTSNTLRPLPGTPAGRPPLPSVHAFEEFWGLAAEMSLLAATIAAVYLVTYWSGFRGGDRAMVRRPAIDETVLIGAGR